MAYSKSRSIQGLKSWEKLATGLTGDTGLHKVNINIFDAGTIRVHAFRSEEEADNFSYAVVSTPESEVQWSLIEETHYLKVKTDLITIRIKKDPLRISFEREDGKIINEDDSGFGMSWQGNVVSCFKKLQEGEMFLGLGEKTGPLNKRGRGYQNWNTDSFAYHSEQDPLYCTFPFYIGIHNGIAYGVFFDNTHRSYFNFGASNDRYSSFYADEGQMNYYFLYDTTLEGILKRYTKLTGRMEMPPLWSLGYQQCRYSYYPDKEVYSVANTFREKDIPADAIVFDIHYMDEYRIFTWDRKRFHNPEKMIADLKKIGFRTVVMCDPGIKVETGYDPYDSGIKEDIFIKYPDGTNYSGAVWPGWCHFPDFTNPKARDWWGKKLKYYTDMGIDGFWNDMNEIATWGQFLPEHIEMDFDGQGGTSKRGRNIYGHQMSRSTYDGVKKNKGGNYRVFNLTRAAYSGVQRHSAVWTGDNVASDDHMILGTRLISNLGLAGVSFAGYDVGGFVGNASEHLFARWIQLGAFTPFFRGHSMINSRDSEPWSYGEEVEEISRNFIKLRYRLMMYLYAAFRESAETGIPVVRSLALNWTFDSRIYEGEFQNQYLFGSDILVAPLESYKNFIKVYFPEGVWFDMFNDQKIGPGEVIRECKIERLPVYIRESAIIAICPEAGNNTDNLGETVEIHIYDGTRYNQYEHYEDDGETFDHLKGKNYLRKISYNPASNTIHIGEGKGVFKSRFSKWKLVLHGFSSTIFLVNGKNTEAKSTSYRFIEPISNFDPLGQEIDMTQKIGEVKVIELGPDNQETIIHW